MWWVFAVMALLGWGGWYLGTYSGNFQPDVYDERPGVAAAQVGAPAPQADPMILGKRLYANCQACHQAGGEGVEGTYPPLRGSEWVTGDPETVVRILLHGAQGSMEVQGKAYNQAMPAWKHLKDDQLAAVATYVRGSWGNTAAPVSVETVAAVRAATSGRTQPWTMADLKRARQEPSQVAAAGI
jgi:mono/diheme cytochrome c family protein